jgi:hypothetical protein
MLFNLALKYFLSNGVPLLNIRCKILNYRTRIFFSFKIWSFVKSLPPIQAATRLMHNRTPGTCNFFGSPYPPFIKPRRKGPSAIA